jgi:hypothetical protein
MPSKSTDIQSLKKDPRDNLIPFKPGQSGNPAGRPPKDLSITSVIKKKLSEPGKLDAIADKIIDELTKKIKREYPTGLLKEVLDRTEGKVIPDVSASIDNRTINIIVPSEHARELTQNINKRLMAKE